MKNKKYIVSLFCSVPFNTDIEIEAKNEREAEQKAIKKYDEGEGEIDGPFWGDAHLNIGKIMSDGLHDGVNIEEVE